VANCAECKRCWSIKDLNVMFRLRWGGRNRQEQPAMFDFASFDK